MAGSSAKTPSRSRGGGINVFAYVQNNPITYHANGRLKSITDLTGRSISYDEYTGNGQRKKITYFPGTPDQRVFTYDYDAGRPGHIYALTLPLQ
jgi:hypothetical protein